jgi:hypothetical protein
MFKRPLRLRECHADPDSKILPKNLTSSESRCIHECRGLQTYFHLPVLLSNNAIPDFIFPIEPHKTSQRIPHQCNKYPTQAKRKGKQKKKNRNRKRASRTRRLQVRNNNQHNNRNPTPEKHKSHTKRRPSINQPCRTNGTLPSLHDRLKGPARVGAHDGKGIGGGGRDDGDRIWWWWWCRGW